MGKKIKKLNLNEKTPSPSINDAFSALNLEGLPVGPTNFQDPSPSDRCDRTQHDGHGKRGELILRRETSHRGGKRVIIVSGLDLLQSGESIHDLATRLKMRCACGGTVKDGEIIIQGEKAAQIAEFLREEGFRVRGETT